CQTGLGKVHDAGVIGLSRAFQIAGVPRVVMSLWSVNDKATAELMKSFVKYLQTHMPSEALRLAMLDVRKRRPEPSQWASFVLFGTPR
ncbi:MAG: CHAT domain-containing protein, partial [Acidobacteria bacterium]|nr:CHAT domain-containing protein [Acidobacteriota bacterium]